NWANIIGNPLLAIQHTYNWKQQQTVADQLHAFFNPEQFDAYNTVYTAIPAKTGKPFFLHGPGGTGKTYVFRVLAAQLCTEIKVVLCVASPGIAVFFLPGDQTSYSCSGFL
ncbi:PIF1-like helicase-domain-containing protein, partial [Pterulicium gracile]